MNKCTGCGIILQTEDETKDGYVSKIDHNLCSRCFAIKNYNRNSYVVKNQDDYLEIIKKIKDNDVVIYVSSLLTLNLDYINNFKNVILILTKRDVLPKSVNDLKLINYVKKRYNHILKVIIVSAYKKYNLDILYNELLLYKNKKIYFVGLTNSGKSTLINEMIHSYNGVMGNITMSNYPSTTLDIIDVSIGELTIKDTPGMVIDNSIINELDDKEIKKINTKKEIKPITFQVKDAGSILFGELFRIDYQTSQSSMTCYISNNILVKQISKKNMEMLTCDNYEYDIPDNTDLVIEDIGFIKVTKGVKLKIYSNYNLYLYLRDNLI